MKLLIVSGVSGSGKSKAMNYLEDMGYFCIDNLPHTLFTNLLELNVNEKKLAISVDSRTLYNLEGTSSIDDILNSLNVEKRILFLDTQDNILLRRFKETRRLHPMIKDNMSIERAIELERELLLPVRAKADFLLDTSTLSLSQFKEKLTHLFAQDSNVNMVVNFISFGFKYGTPHDSDLMFDVRCLPNPYYIESLKHKTGLDNEVYDYVLSHSESQLVLKRIKDFLKDALPLYIKEGKSSLNVSIGCTGGKHRSVTFVRALEKFAKRKGYHCYCTHREIN